MRSQYLRAPAATMPLVRRRITAFLAFLVLAAGMALSAAPARAQDDPPDRVGRLADSQGKVWIFDDQKNDWEEIFRNQPISAGDRISTDNDARAEVRIGTTVLRLGAGTDIEMRELSDEHISVGLGGGTLAARVRSTEAARELEVTTAEGRFQPAVAGHYRIDRSDDRLAGTSWVGDLRFDGNGTTFLIPAGRRAEIDSRGGHNYTDVDRDEFSDWVARNDQNDEGTRASSRYVSPDMTGAEDLDRYGDWDSHTDYGAIWYPRTVAVGWAPYRYGRWTWVAPWGWTWVDDAPWGFAPSHYGRWVYNRNRWGWCPGSYVARPVYSPALVGWIGGGHVSLSISIGGPPIGWVPLAPREVYRPVYVVSPGYWRRLNGPGVALPPHRPPTGPIMYANRNHPGAVTVVSADVLKRREPVAPAFQRVDSRTRQEIVSRATVETAPPDAPAGRAAPGVRRVVAEPGRVRLDRNPPPRPTAQINDRAPNRGDGPARAGADDRRAAPVVRDSRDARNGRDDDDRRDVRNGNAREEDRRDPRSGRDEDRRAVQPAPRDSTVRSRDAKPIDDAVPARPRSQRPDDGAPPPRAPRSLRSEDGAAERPHAPSANGNGRATESPRAQPPRTAPREDDGERRAAPRPTHESTNDPRGQAPVREAAPRAPAEVRGAMPSRPEATAPRAPSVQAPPQPREAPQLREAPRQRIEAPDRGGPDRSGPGRNQ